MKEVIAETSEHCRIRGTETNYSLAPPFSRCSYTCTRGHTRVGLWICTETFSATMYYTSIFKWNIHNFPSSVVSTRRQEKIVLHSYCENPIERMRKKETSSWIWKHGVCFFSKLRHSRYFSANQNNELLISSGAGVASGFFHTFK